jgi:acetyltransferase
MCRQAGVTRAATVEEAFEAAAAFVTQPLPAGPNVFVLTTVGGWGVVTADRLAASPTLTLMPLPDDLGAAFDARLPPRWSRNNPADLAGSETRDTVGECLELAAGHAEVHALLFLGLGIQSNQGALERRGRFYPDHGLERIVAYHERQDRQVAARTVELAAACGKPVLVASELAATHPDNPGMAELRARGGFAFPSSFRAVTALEHLCRYAVYRRRGAREGVPS